MSGSSAIRFQVNNNVDAEIYNEEYKSLSSRTGGSSKEEAGA